MSCGAFSRRNRLSATSIIVQTKVILGREAARPREDWVRGFAEERPNE
jgi:hypothetical protein